MRHRLIARLEGIGYFLALHMQSWAIEVPRVPKPLTFGRVPAYCCPVRFFLALVGGTVVLHLRFDGYYIYGLSERARHRTIYTDFCSSSFSLPHGLVAACPASSTRHTYSPVRHEASIAVVS